MAWMRIFKRKQKLPKVGEAPAIQVSIAKASAAKKDSKTVSEVEQFAGATMVDIHVGTDENSAHFKLHKSILCTKVPYFEKMFNRRFLEGTTNSATLPEDDPELFNILVSWIYSGQIPALHNRPEDDLEWLAWDFYVLADEFYLPDLMDQTLDVCLISMSKGNWMPRVGVLQRMHDCSIRKSSGMFRLVAAFVCYILCTYRATKDEEDWPTRELHTILGNNEDL
ncbi:hypothetical protein OCU04_002249 [Sclerotinia nivalis]|uniref:BTB domain-containing protein n=1 Tax=Sclerotinia nivalis TaxID=352851 RepID=A0A9X0AZQ3_9HELO|nr:hypothetical protein OCU04_002249 [Sclerotinia nivalis]